MLTVSENTVKQWAAAGAQDDPKFRANLPKHLREKKQSKSRIRDTRDRLVDVRKFYTGMFHLSKNEKEVRKNYFELKVSNIKNRGFEYMQGISLKIFFPISFLI